jgi:hypothetical protein
LVDKTAVTRGTIQVFTGGVEVGEWRKGGRERNRETETERAREKTKK